MTAASDMAMLAPERLLADARLHHGRAEFNGACLKSRHVLVHWPTNGEAALLLAGALDGAGRWQAARRAFERIEVIRPDEIRHRSPYLRVLLRLRLYSKAWRVGRKIAVHDPASLNAWAALARIRAIHGQTADVIGFLGIMNCLRPDDLSVAIGFSRSMMEMRDLKAAETWCRRAIELGGETAERLLDLGRILWALEAFGVAEAALERAVAIDPDLALKARAARLTVTDSRFARPADRKPAAGVD